MSVLLISNFLRISENKDWILWSWAKDGLPAGFETFDAIILDFTNIDELGRVDEVHLQLMNEIPKLLEISNVRLVCISGIKNVEIYDYDPSKDDPQSWTPSSIYPGEIFEPNTIKVYDIFGFLSDIVTIESFETIEEIMRTECQPSEFENYFDKKIKKNSYVYFKFKNKKNEIFALRKGRNMPIPVSCRIWFKRGEIIFLPGYHLESNRKAVVAALSSLINLRSRPAWFFDFVERNLPSRYYIEKQNLHKIFYESEMIFETGDYPIHERDKQILHSNNLVDRIKLAFEDILNPIGGKVIISKSDQDRRGVDLKIVYGRKELIVQVKGIEGKTKLKDTVKTREYISKYKSTSILFLVNTHRLKPFDARINYGFNDNFDKRIIEKCPKIKLMTVCEFYLLWKDCLDEKIDRKKLADYILSDSTPNIISWSESIEKIKK